MKITATGGLWPALHHRAIYENCVWAMRRSCMILLVLLLSATLLTANSTNGQDIETTEVSIGMTKEPLLTGLKKIEQQTVFRFAYMQSVLTDFSNISLPVKKRSVKETLELLLKGTGLSYTVSKNSIGIYRKQVAATGNEEDYPATGNIVTADTAIRGRITDSTGNPLAGASIALEGTNYRTATDKDGMFSLTGLKPGRYRLVATFLGFEPGAVSITIPQENNAVLQLALKISIQNMGDVKVYSTGFETLPRERATGSFAEVDNELFNRKISTNILDRLDGIVSGVLFERGIQIRGLSTLGIGTSTQPLIILDNFPYEGNINNINPNDVENITILKDAAASSIWGATAGNGVIVITTKKGNFNQPVKTSVTSNVTVIQKPDLFQTPIISTSEYIDLEKFLFDKGFYNSQINNINTRPPLTPVIELLIKQQAGQISQQQADAQINAWRNRDVRNDFEKYIYRNTVNQQFAANISGGSQLVKWIFSAGYDRNLADLIGNSYNRVTFRTDHTITPVKKLQLQIGVGYNHSKSENNNPGPYNSSEYRLSGGRYLYPYAQFADEDGNPMSYDIRIRGIYSDTMAGGRLLNWRYSPLEEIANRDNVSLAGAFIGNMTIKYDFTKALSAEIRYQYQKTTGENRNHNNINTFMTRNLVNQFTQVTGNTLKYNIPKDGILNLSNSWMEGHAVRGQLNFNRKWNQIHSIKAIAGGEIRQVHSWSSSSRTYGYNDRLNFTNMDYVNQYPTLPGGNAFIPSNNNFQDRLNRFVALYANAGYTYRERYTVTASARKDASNLFGVKTNDKGRPLWSSGFRWNISKEKFYKSGLFPDLNFRITYGTSGNLSLERSAIITLNYFPATNQPITNIPYSSVNNYPNPSLRWERVGTTNIALDWATKKNRISGSMEYYWKKSIDLFGSEELDPTTGIPTMWTNSANMTGKGLDVTINTRNIDRGGFLWQTTALFSYTTNKVTAYLNPVNTQGFKSDGSLLTPLVGYNPYMIVSYRWAGLDPATGDPRGYVNGQISKNYTDLVRTPLTDQVFHGQAVPPYFGSVLNNFSWKGFSLSANITYRFGYYFRRNTLSYTTLLNFGLTHNEYFNRWQQPGDENFTNVPSFIYPLPNANRDLFYNNSEITVEKGDHIRLEDVRFAYSLDKKIWPKMPFRQLHFYTYMTNLNIVMWKANGRGIDPRYPDGVLPGRSIAIGIRADF